MNHINCASDEFYRQIEKDKKITAAIFGLVSIIAFTIGVAVRR